MIGTEYTIHELSRLAGVTPRTLRWYDQIGLLTPSRVAENGYRCYGEAEVNRLQEILYYRALGVELAEIKRCLDAPSNERLTTLQGHLTALQREQERISRLIRSVQESIEAEERKETMDNEKKFEAFKRHMVEENERTYGEEARAKYGDTEVDAFHAIAMKLSQPLYEEWKALDEAIRTGLETAVRNGVQPESDEASVIVERHRRWLTIISRGYDAHRHRGIAQLYVMDERFTAYYDRNVPGCARLLCDAVQHWAK